MSACLLQDASWMIEFKNILKLCKMKIGWHIKCERRFINIRVLA